MTHIAPFPRLCLAASGGGHIRQLLDLEDFWSAYDYFFVTEDTALGRSIAQRHDVEFVPHFAIGQAKLGAPLLMLGRAWKSLWRSFAIIRRRRPEFVVTTGAGSQVFIVLWGRLFGARIVLVDSFARFEKPSAFAHLVGPLAHRRIAQSAKAARNWSSASVCDPLCVLDTPSPEKAPLLFATVGATLPFERLTRLVLEAKIEGDINEEVVLQVGLGADAYEPVEGVKFVDSLPFDQVQELLQRARIVVCHGGTGSLITALRAHCRTIVVPRSYELGEHYDNHQEEIASSFAQRGLVMLARDSRQFRKALRAAPDFNVTPVTTDYRQLIDELRRFVNPIEEERASAPRRSH